MFIYQKILIESDTAQKINYEIINLDISSYSEYFNYLNIDYLKNHCPELFKWMRELDLHPVKAAIIITDFNLYDFNSKPHIDMQVNSLALNFPIKNCEESETIFYTTRSPLEKVILKKPNGVVYASLKNKDWIEIKKYTLDSAILLNTHIPHKVIHRGKNSRVALSIRFDPDPWELIE